MKVASGYYTKVNTCIKFFQKNMFSFRIIIQRFHTQFRVFDNKGVPMLTFRINVLTYVNTLQDSAKEKRKKRRLKFSFCRNSVYGASMPVYCF